MTVAGWVAGISVIGFISPHAHWIAFILVLFIGGKMMWEGIQGERRKA
jgi:putative Mn2+ efflux pump MntP